jgi:hypothetical protein
MYLKVWQDLLWIDIETDCLTTEVLLFSSWVSPLTTVITLCYLMWISYSTYWFSVTFQNCFDCTGCMTTRSFLWLFQCSKQENHFNLLVTWPDIKIPLFPAFHVLWFVANITEHVLPWRLQLFVSGRLSARSQNQVGYVDRKDSI